MIEWLYVVGNCVKMKKIMCVLLGSRKVDDECIGRLKIKSEW